jgi:hypothetical protein
VNLLLSELALTDPLLGRAFPWSSMDHDDTWLPPASSFDEEPVIYAEPRRDRRHWLLSAPRLSLLRRVFSDSN